MRLLTAAADAAAHGADLTTTEVVRRAGVGRNTFYEHFDNVGAAIREACRGPVTETCAALASAQHGARTPIERLRALATAWVRQVTDNPRAFHALATGGSATAADATTVRTTLTEQLGAALVAARASGTIALGPEPFRVACVVGAYEAASAHLVADPGSDAKRAAELLVDLTLRAFR